MRYEECLRLGIASWEGLWSTFEGCHDSLAGLADWAPVYREAAWTDALFVMGADPAQSRGRSALHRCPMSWSPAHSRRHRSGSLGRHKGTDRCPDQRAARHPTPQAVSQAGLDTVLDAVVISGEAGFGKPEGAAFSLILGQLGVQATDAIMVGDSWERDVLGSLNVGMRAVSVSHGRQPPEQRGEVLIVDELTSAVFEAL